MSHRRQFPVRRFPVRPTLRPQSERPAGTPLVAIAFSVAAWASALSLFSGVRAQDIVPAADGTGTIVAPDPSAGVESVAITGGQMSGDGRNLFHSFDDFNLTTGATATFATTPAIENVLSRTTGGNASYIDGTLALVGSQADLYLINPAGIVFGDRARLDVPADFMATTADAIGFGELDRFWWSATSGTANWAALSGEPSGFAFRRADAGAIVNAGSLSVNPGHSFSAIGGTIANTGTIAAPAGTVTALAVPGERLVRLSVPGNVLSLEVVPIVSPATDLPRAATLPELLTGNAALRQASQLSVNPDGSVSLSRSTTPEIGIASESGTVLLSGAIDVANEISPDFGAAQQATILGDRIAVLDATIDASGVAGGGTVLVGGEFQGNGTLPNADVLYVNSGARILSDAIGTGNGGTAILWADGVTIADGTISARGENGGFVEISGKQTLSFNGTVDVRGTTGADGTVLFDPDDLSVGGDYGDDGGSPPPADDGGSYYSGDDGVAPPPADSGGGYYSGDDGVASPPADDGGSYYSGDSGSSPPSSDDGGDYYSSDDGISSPPAGDGDGYYSSNSGSPPPPPNDGGGYYSGDDGISSDPLPNDDFNDFGDVDFENGNLDDRGDPTIDPPPNDDFDDFDNFGEFDDSDFDDPIANPPPDGNGDFGDPILFDPDDPAVSFRDRVDNLDTTDPETIAQLEDRVTELPPGERRDAQRQIDDRVAALELETRNDPNAAIARFIRSQGADRRLTLDRNLSEIRNEQLARVSGNIVFLAENSLTVDRPVTRTGSVAFEAGNSLSVDAPIVVSGTAANIFLSAGNDIDINANLVSSGSGNITIVADDAGLADDVGRRGRFSPTGVSIVQGLGTTIDAGSGNVSIVLAGDEVNSIVLGDITTTGAVSVNANGGNILRRDNTSVIRANTGSFITSGTGQIGEANNPLTVDIVQLTSQVGSGLSFVNDLNRNAIRDNTRQLLQEVPDGEGGEVAGDASEGDEVDSRESFEIDDIDDIEDDRGEVDREGDGEGDDDDGEGDSDREFDDFDDLEGGDSNVFAEIEVDIAALERDRLAEFGRFLGPNLSAPSISTANAREALAEIARLTGSQSAAVYVTLLPDRLDLLVFSSDAAPIRRSVEIDRDTVVETVAELRYAISNPRARLRRSTRYLDLGQQLYTWLIDPIAEELEANRINTLVFSMPTGLRGLPVAALYDSTRDRFLVEDYSLGLIPSLALIDMQYRTLQDTELLAMGASEFESLAALPAVPLELDTIANSLWDGTTLLNETFTRVNIMRSRSRNPYPILHLATHGEFGGGENGSFIQLWDERLHLDEIRNLGWNDPPVELLVLSACQTAVGDAEAELGFAGFAVAAGVKSALASLWYVSDVGTMVLMTQFYHHLASAGIKAEALRAAQVALIRNDFELLDTGEIYFPSFDRSFPLPPGTTERAIRNLSHPYYWSAFTMIGSPW